MSDRHIELTECGLNWITVSLKKRTPLLLGHIKFGSCGGLPSFRQHPQHVSRSISFFDLADYQIPFYLSHTVCTQCGWPTSIHPWQLCCPPNLVFRNTLPSLYRNVEESEGVIGLRQSYFDWNMDEFFPYPTVDPHYQSVDLKKI